MAQTNRQEQKDASAKRGPIITVDYDRYEKFLSHENDMSDEGKREFVQALWEIMLQLAVYGVRFEREKSNQPACGQLLKNQENPSSPTTDAIHYSHQDIATQFGAASISKSTSAVEEEGP